VSSDDWIGQLRTQLLTEFPGVDLLIHASASGYAVLALLNVPPDLRNRGIGTAIIERILAEADHRGVPTALTPSDAYGSSVARLRRFYRRLGFVPNTGRRRDFRIQQSMLRAPAAPGTRKPEGSANDSVVSKDRSAQWSVAAA